MGKKASYYKGLQYNHTHMHRVLLCNKNQCGKTNVSTNPQWLLGILTTLRKKLTNVLSSYKLYVSVKHSGKQTSCKFATEECAQE